MNETDLQCLSKESPSVDSGSEGKALAAARSTLFLWVHLFPQLCNMEEVQLLCNHGGRGFQERTSVQPVILSYLGVNGGRQCLAQLKP